MVKRVLVLCLAVMAAVTVACSSDAGTDAVESTDTSGDTVGGSASPTGEPTPPRLPDDFTWIGRYVVPDLDVEVPFTWNGRGGDFQMIAGGEGEAIHFTNLIYDGHLYTLTYEWPDVPRNPCSYVGPFTVEEFNEGLAEASLVGRETLHGEPDRLVDHYRSTSVLDLPADTLPAMDGAPQLRLPLMAADIYVGVEDPDVFWQVLHFGLQNLYDPDLDEWIVIDEATPLAGEVSLPDECAVARAQAEGDAP